MDSYEYTEDANTCISTIQYQNTHSSKNHINININPPPPPNRASSDPTTSTNTLLLEMPPHLETRNGEHDPLPDRMLPRRPVDNVLPHDLPPFDEHRNLYEHIQ